MLTREQLFDLPGGTHIRRLGVTFELHHYSFGDVALETIRQDPGYSVWFHQAEPDPARESEWLELAHLWDIEANVPYQLVDDPGNDPGDEHMFHVR
jgi:hypothetical protein